MRKIAATYICIPNSPPFKNSILVLEDDGILLEIIDTQGKLTEQAGLEFYSGLLVPCITSVEFNEFIVKQQNDQNTTILDCIGGTGFEVGNKTEVCLITGMDLVNMRLLPSSKIKRLI